MNNTQVFLDYINGKEAAARLVKGRLDDLFLGSGEFAEGTIFRAKVDRLVKRQGGAFVSFPGGKGFLRSISSVSSGQKILVQVSGYAEKGKAIPVTEKLLFKSRYVVITPKTPGLNISRKIKDKKLRSALFDFVYTSLPPLSFGMILRSSCEKADFEDVLQDAKQMCDSTHAVLDDKRREPCLILKGDGPHKIAWREWTTKATIFREKGCLDQEGVLDLLEELKKSKVDTTSGSYFIESTHALTAVDVNTGADSSMATGLKANIAMAKDLPRQLRLRGIGGQIVIDPAPMPRKDRSFLDRALNEAFRQDSVKTHILGWTTLGLIELQRAKIRAPLKL